MATYRLQPNEVLLIKDSGVAHGVGFSPFTSELTLTNLNLVLVKKGVFGNVKATQTFPVNQIKLYNQQAQAFLGKASNGADTLDVYFVNGQEQFRFPSGGKRKILSWVAKINEAVTGYQSGARFAGDDSSAIPGTEMIADSLRDTFAVFKGTFGPRAAAPEVPASASGKCGACGAPTIGFQGQTVNCDYCGSAQQL